MPVILFAFPTAGCIFRAVPVGLKIPVGVPVAPRCAPVSSTATNGCLSEYLVSNFKILSTCCSAFCLMMCYLTLALAQVHYRVIVGRRSHSHSEWCILKSGTRRDQMNGC